MEMVGPAADRVTVLGALLALRPARQQAAMAILVLVIPARAVAVAHHTQRQQVMAATAEYRVAAVLAAERLSTAARPAMAASVRAARFGWSLTAKKRRRAVPVALTF
jgi:hypothetical protein